MKFKFFILTFIISINIYATTIKEIKFDGLVHISDAVALRILDMRDTEELDYDKLDYALKKFYKQSYFEDIYADFTDGVLTISFKEKPLISKVEIKGYKEDDDDAQKSLLQIKRGSIYDVKRINSAKKRIIDALASEGKIDSVVEVETKYLKSGSAQVTFIVNEGENIIIEKMRFEGVNGLDPSQFNEVMANKEYMFPGFIPGFSDGKLMLDQLQYDPLRIRDFYMQYGYLDAKIDEPFVRADFNSYKATVSYQVFEGDVYRISHIILSQSKKVVETSKIHDVIKLKINEPFNIKTFREDSERVKTIIADKGYAFVQVVPDLQKNKEKLTVDVVYRIKPGKKVRIRNVIIEGNNRTLDRIIRRELFLAPGDMYNLTDLKDSKNALGRAGFFESSTIEEKRINDHQMDLIVKVKEAPTGNIQLGGGYGSFGGLLLSVAVNDRNIWGSGINVGLKLEKSERTQNYSFNIANPHLDDSDYSGNFSIYWSSYLYNDYTVNTKGISIGTGHRFTRYVTGYLGYNFSDVSYDNFDPSSIPVDSLRFFESYSKSSVTISASFDNTDDYYLPREGYAITQSLEKSGLGGEANYAKSRSTFNKYIGLEDYVNLDVIFRYKARYFIASDTGYLPLAERFYMGGLGSVRGYQAYSLSPVALDNNGAKRNIGGKQTFSNSVELSFPLVPKAKMRLVTYLDFGSIGTDSLFDDLYADADNKPLDTYTRAGYGAGIEWFSPVGPIQLMYAQPLLEQRGDRTSNFEFTIGQRF